MRKTKIICTLGPSTDDPEVLKQLMLNGMDVARVNMSHQDHDAQRVRIGAVKKLREELNLPVALLLDTKGPEIRTGNFSTPKVELEEGQIFTLTTNDVVGDNTVSSVTFQGLPQDVKRGDRILIDDGLIEMVVESTTDTDVVCTVINGGTISSHKGINVPGVTLSMPFISPKDEADIAFAVEEGFDFIAASFTRSCSRWGCCRTWALAFLSCSRMGTRRDFSLPNTRLEYSDIQAVMASACLPLKNNRYLSGSVW